MSHNLYKDIKIHMYKFAFLLFIVFSLPSFAGSKCQLEWDSLKSVQSQLRKNSNEWLRNEERRRHKIYQDCRKGKNNASSKTQKHRTQKQTSYTKYKSTPKYRPYRSTTSKVNVKGRFSGEKQQAWLDYYHSPKGCKTPKSTSQFSKCLAHRDSEAEKFDKVWDEQHAPPSIVLGSH